MAMTDSATPSTTTSSTDSRTRLITYDEFMDIFKPRINPATGVNGSWNGRVFETYGKEFAEVQKADDNKVWTLLDNDGEMTIAAGFHRVNRMGHFITEVPAPVQFTEVCDEPNDFFKKIKREGQLKRIPLMYDLSEGMQAELERCRASWSKARKPG
jgi:hypothetical protein